MLPTEPIVLLFDGLEHEGRGVHGLLDGGQLAVLLEVDPAVSAEQDAFPAPVVPVFGGCEGRARGGRVAPSETDVLGGIGAGGPSVDSTNPGAMRPRSSGLG